MTLSLTKLFEVKEWKCHYFWDSVIFWCWKSSLKKLNFRALAINGFWTKKHGTNFFLRNYLNFHQLQCTTYQIGTFVSCVTQFYWCKVAALTWSVFVSRKCLCTPKKSPNKVVWGLQSCPSYAISVIDVNI